MRCVAVEMMAGLAQIGGFGAQIEAAQDVVGEGLRQRTQLQAAGGAGKLLQPARDPAQQREFVADLLQLIGVHQLDGHFAMAVDRHEEPREVRLFGKAAAHRHQIDRAEDRGERPAECACQSLFGFLRRQRGFEMIDCVDGVVQGAGREFGPFSQGLREAARERPERGQHAVQALAAAPGRMHAADQIDHPVQFVVGRGGKPDQASAITQRVEQQQ